MAKDGTSQHPESIGRYVVTRRQLGDRLTALGDDVLRSPLTHVLHELETARLETRRGNRLSRADHEVVISSWSPERKSMTTSEPPGAGGGVAERPGAGGGVV